MGLLGNLLPGVRALRAPFSAGAIVLLAVWLWLAPHPPGGSGGELLKDLRELRDVLSPVGVSVAVGLTAYVAGALITTISDAFVQLILAGGWMRTLTGWVALQVKRTGWDPATAEDQSLTARYEVLTTREPRSLRGFLTLFCGLLIRPRTTFPMELAAIRVVQIEWRQIHMRMLVAQPKLYDQIDRLEAESEFREAVALPALGLGVALSQDLGNWAIAGGAVVFALLAVGSVAAQSTAERTLADVVLDGQVRLPFLDAIAADMEARKPPPNGDRRRRRRLVRPTLA